MNKSNPGHRVETYRDVTDRCKQRTEDYVFMYPLFSGDRAKNYQLRVLSMFREQLK